MKRFLLSALLFVAFLSVLTAETVVDPFNFTLVLNKSGTDSVWFSESDDDNAGKTNRFIFPIVEASDDNDQVLTASLYLHWEMNSDRKNVSIKLSFVGSDDSTKDNPDSAGFMLWSAMSGSANGLNYDVTVKANKGKGTEIKKLTFSSASARLTTTSDRTVTFNPAEKDGENKKYISPALITITVNPASKTSGTYYSTWGQEEQYIGYIKAEILVS
jgi:opacity protein-like surface antigen